MDIVGIDISKTKFDAALLHGERVRHAVFPNTEGGFGQLLAWLAKHRPDPTAPLHACMEATGNWGLELADFLHGQGIRVSVVNPARIKAYGESELARNKTDKLDAGLTARFCRAHVPQAWTPPLPHLRELRELVRRCDALKTDRVQELNRQKSGFASSAVASSIAGHITWLDEQIEAITVAARQLIAADPALARNLALLRSITGFGEISATILLAELPNIAEFTPKALAAFAGLSPQEHSSGTSVRRPSKTNRMGSERLRSTLYMCALSAKRSNKALAAFVGRMTAAGKPPKVILIAVARKLLVYAHAVIRTQKTFDPSPDAPFLRLTSNTVSFWNCTTLRAITVLCSGPICSWIVPERNRLRKVRNQVCYWRPPMTETRPPLPPFTLESAIQKVGAAEDGWNSCDPQRVSLAYTPDSTWRNRAEFFGGRAAIVGFLRRKWDTELEYRLIKELWAFMDDRIAVRFAYEWRDGQHNWFRSYGNENWQFTPAGLMQRRLASINDLPIAEAERKFRWDRPGPRPADHPGLSDLGL